MRSTPAFRTLVLAASLVGSLALAPPAAAAGARSINPVDSVGQWLRGFLNWDRLSWLASEEGSGVDPNGGRTTAGGEPGSIVDSDGALSSATGEAGSGTDPNGAPLDTSDEGSGVDPNG